MARSTRTIPKKKAAPKTGGGLKYVPTAEEKQKTAKDNAIANILGGKEVAAGGAGLAEKLFSEGSLGRVSTGFNPDGTRIAENQGILNQLDAKRGIFSGIGGGRTAATSGVLSSLAAKKDLYSGIGGGRTGATSDYIARLKEASNGYTSQENQAARESMRRGVESNYKTNTRQLSDIAARSNMSGPALAALLAKSGKQRNRDLDQQEQDLFIKDADEKQRRLGQYGQELQGIEGTEYGRSREALSDYTKTNLDVEGQEYDRSRQATSDYADRLDVSRADEAERAKYNIGQMEKERGGYAGTLIGSANVAEQRRATKEQEGIAKKQLKLAGGGGRSGRTSPGQRITSSTGNTKVNMYDDIINLTKSTYG